MKESHTQDEDTEEPMTMNLRLLGTVLDTKSPRFHVYVVHYCITHHDGASPEDDQQPAGG